MGKNKRILTVIFIVLLQSLVNVGLAKPNIQVLNPTGYSIEVYYDNAPFYVGNGMVYALPKGLNVSLLGLSGFYQVYCQLPDGSRGYMQELFFEGNTMTLPGRLYHDDKSISVREGDYDIVSLGNWKYENKVGYYTFVSDLWRLKNQATGQAISIPAGATGVKVNRADYLYRGQLPEESLNFDVIVLVKNPDDLKNLIGLSMEEVENYLGRSKAFVGDALTDVGYAYSFYRNVAYTVGEERKYGLNVYYDKNSVCVAAQWDTYASGKYKRPEEYSVELPKKSSGAVAADIGSKAVKAIPRYDSSIVPVSYEHKAGLSLKSLSFRRLARDIIAGENVLSTLLSIFLFYGLFLLAYTFFLKHTSVGSNGFHIGVIVLVGVAFYAVGFYGLLKFRVIDILWGIPALTFIVWKLIIGRWNSISSNRCKYCHYYYGDTMNSIRKGGYDTQRRSAHAIRKEYTEIGELEKLNDEQVRRWETVYKHEVTTSQYGKYEDHIVCPRCIASWIVKHDVLENSYTDTVGYSKHVREEIWKLRRAD